LKLDIHVFALFNIIENFNLIILEDLVIRLYIFKFTKSVSLFLMYSNVCYEVSSLF